MVSGMPMSVDTVLVVDDSATDSHLICNALTAAGFNTLSVGNAEEALSVAKTERPQAILMDVVMPGTNGFQATRMLHNDPETADIPVIILSSKNKASDRVWGLRQGAVGYITKPFSNQELISKLRDL
jgi:twitching motility two-component system response regulator PilH